MAAYEAPLRVGSMEPGKKGGHCEKGGVTSIVHELPFTLVDSDRTGEPFSFVLRSAQSPGIMKYPFLFSLASLESPSSLPMGETVVKILHVNPVSEVVEIWQSAAAEYERAHPGAKIQFDYLDHEEFNAKLPMLIQSSDCPSVFHSWGGGVMLECCPFINLPEKTKGRWGPRDHAGDDEALPLA